MSFCREGHALISDTYKRFFSAKDNGWLDVQNLLDPLQSHDEALVVEALKRHIMDARERDGSLVGKWPPTTADIYWNIKEIEKAAAAAKRDAATSRTVTIPQGGLRAVDVPDHIKSLIKRDYVEVYSTEALIEKGACPECLDDGWVKFFIDHHDSTGVYTKQEWVNMELTEANKLQTGQCVCTCGKGTDIWDVWRDRPRKPWHLKQVPHRWKPCC